MFKIFKFRPVSHVSRVIPRATFSAPRNAVSKSLRNRRRLNWILGCGVAGLGIWGVDHYYYYSTLERNFRTVISAVIVGVDYKLNFNVDNAENIDKLHLRSAKRILNTCLKNGGLYIKFGQQIASLNGISPPEYSDTFRVLYDDAPSVPYSDVCKIICNDFAVSDPSEIFASFEEHPMASASIAQVHRATLHDGTKVAVKIQKPAIENQIDMDLFTYRMILTVFEYFFAMPLTWSSAFVESHLKQETDFVNEMENSNTAKQYLSENKDFIGRVYIPKCYEEYTTKRVLTMEWIDGVRFQDIKQHEEIPVKETMATVVDVFSDQIFRTGFVHADPHAGNILVRRNPSDPSKHQIVLLDHGLYIKCSEKFRIQYVHLWKAMFTNDIEKISEIARSWGIRDPDMFAASTVQQQWNRSKPITIPNNPKEIFAMHKEASKRVREFLSDTDRLPKELIFIGRNLNIVRSNNKGLGSPVNRINMMANWAIRQIGSDWSAWAPRSHPSPFVIANSNQALVHQIYFVVATRLNYLIFRLGLLLSSITFQVIEVWRVVYKIAFGKELDGFEELIDKQMKNVVEAKYGVVLDESSF